MQPEITVRSSVSVSRNSTHRGSFLPCKQCHRSIAHSDRRVLRVAAQQQQQEQKPAVAKFADSVGLPTEEGLFGFKPFPEVCEGLFTRCSFVQVDSVDGSLCVVCCDSTLNCRYGWDAWP